MATSNGQSAVWVLVRRQHGVISRSQLVGLGYSAEAIRHRIKVGRLHCLYRGVYAVGRAELTDRGRWMAAVLACGHGAVLSHESAAALWGLRRHPAGAPQVSVPAKRHPRQPKIHIHRRSNLPPEHLTTRERIPVTDLSLTFVDLATRVGRDSLEEAVNVADRDDLIDPEALRTSLLGFPPIPGLARLRATLDIRTFTLTDSELERRFLRIVDRAGLPRPLTQQRVNGYRVDFYWPDVGLIVETDGLRYHRTPAEQARDRRRDQAHTAAGLTPLRFTNAQIRHEPATTTATLAACFATAHASRAA